MANVGSDTWQAEAWRVVGKAVCSGQRAVACSADSLKHSGVSAAVAPHLLHRGAQPLQVLDRSRQRGRHARVHALAARLLDHRQAAARQRRAAQLLQREQARAKVLARPRAARGIRSIRACGSSSAFRWDSGYQGKVQTPCPIPHPRAQRLRSSPAMTDSTAAASATL